MKKLLTLLLVVILCFALVACDGCNSGDNVESGSESGGNKDGNGNDLEKLPFGDSDSPIELPILPYD